MLVAVAFFAGACSGGSSGSNAGDPGHPKAGEVFLEPVAEVGPNPFTKSVALAPVPDVATSKAVGQGSDDGLGSVRGSTSGLYGVAGTQQVCDAAFLVSFLGDNSDKAQAWVDALNHDATLQWSGGAKLSGDDIPTYIGELTPVFLLADTRVTNYGFKSGDAIAHQSVLQRGSAVLVDQQGMPRVRCASGNPLTAPEPAAKPKYRGDKWPGFSQTKLVIVLPSAETLTTIRVVDIRTQETIEIATGTCLTCDATLQTTTTSTTLFDETTTTTTTAKKSTTTIKPTTTTGVAPTTTVPATTSTTTPTTTTPTTTP